MWYELVVFRNLEHLLPQMRINRKLTYAKKKQDKQNEFILLILFLLKSSSLLRLKASPLMLVGLKATFLRSAAGLLLTKAWLATHCLAN